MANETNIFAELIAHCKEYGYIFQSSEIYDGLSAVYDYGQNGAQLKKNILQLRHAFPPVIPDILF